MLNVAISSSKLANSMPWVVNVGVTSDHPVAVSPYTTPFDNASIFACAGFVVHDATTGERVQNQGARGKRLANPEPVSVGSAPITTEVDLSKCFSFQAGHMYDVQYSGHTKTNTKTKVQLKSFNEHSFMAWEESGPVQKKGVISFLSCESTTEFDTLIAETNAKNAIADALENNLDPGCTGSEYTNFFSDYFPDRFNLVRSHYEALATAFDAPYVVACDDPDCEDTVYAFVYVDDATRTIHVCGLFVQAESELGIDSQPGVLIHEMSHFNSVIASRDYMYGFNDVQDDLALDGTGNCLWNADTIEYYIEQILSGASDCCADLTVEECTTNIACGVDGDACAELSQIEDFTQPFSMCLDSTPGTGEYWYSDFYGNGEWLIVCQDFSLLEALDYDVCDSSPGTSPDGLETQDACCACGGGDGQWLDMSYEKYLTGAALMPSASTLGLILSLGLQQMIV